MVLDGCTNLKHWKMGKKISTERYKGLAAQSGHRSRAFPAYWGLAKKTLYFLSAKTIVFLIN